MNTNTEYEYPMSGSVTIEVANETRSSSSMQTAKYLLVTFSYNSVSDMYEWYNLIVKYPISAKNDIQDMPPLAMLTWKLWGIISCSL